MTERVWNIKTGLNACAGNEIDKWMSVNNHMEHFFSVYNWMPFEEKWKLFSDSTMDIINNDKANIEFWERDFEKTAAGNDYDRILYMFEKMKKCLHPSV